jgi:hypothetical protein
LRWQLVRRSPQQVLVAAPAPAWRVSMTIAAVALDELFLLERVRFNADAPQEELCRKHMVALHAFGAYHAWTSTWDKHVQYGAYW